MKVCLRIIRYIALIYSALWLAGCMTLHVLSTIDNYEYYNDRIDGFHLAPSEKLLLAFSENYAYSFKVNDNIIELLNNHKHKHIGVSALSFSVDKENNISGRAQFTINIDHEGKYGLDYFTNLGAQPKKTPTKNELDRVLFLNTALKGTRYKIESNTTQYDLVKPISVKIRQPGGSSEPLKKIVATPVYLVIDTVEIALVPIMLVVYPILLYED